MMNVIPPRFLGVFLIVANNQDVMYMKRALELAAIAEGDTSPNPMVGCVVVRDGKVVGEGYHHKAGQPHAEVEAMQAAKYKVQGATAYVTLEPCSHFGKVGPCCRVLAARGITRVVCAMEDPNPKVAGDGIKYLKTAGVQVEVGVCQKEAERLNEKFLFAVTHDRPFVSLKYAMTLDGKIATVNGDSEWITGEIARKKAHYLRKTHDAILVGIGTILADNSELTTRLVKGKNALRVVLDSKLQIPMTSAVLNDAADTLIFTGINCDKDRKKALCNLEHVDVQEVEESNGCLDLKQVLTCLGKREVRSVLVEGGARIHGAFVNDGFVERVFAFVAPKICGGQDSLSPVGGMGVEYMNDAVQLQNMEVEQLGEDILMTARVVR